MDVFLHYQKPLPWKVYPDETLLGLKSRICEEVLFKNAEFSLTLNGRLLSDLSPLPEIYKDDTLRIVSRLPESTQVFVVVFESSLSFPGEKLPSGPSGKLNSSHPVDPSPDVLHFVQRLGKGQDKGQDNGQGKENLELWTSSDIQLHYLGTFENSEIGCPEELRQNLTFPRIGNLPVTTVGGFQTIHNKTLFLCVARRYETLHKRRRSWKTNWKTNRKRQRQGETRALATATTSESIWKGISLEDPSSVFPSSDLEVNLQAELQVPKLLMARQRYLPTAQIELRQLCFAHTSPRNYGKWLLWSQKDVISPPLLLSLILEEAYFYGLDAPFRVWRHPRGEGPVQNSEDFTEGFAEGCPQEFEVNLTLMTIAKIEKLSGKCSRSSLWKLYRLPEDDKEDSSPDSAAALASQSKSTSKSKSKSASVISVPAVPLGSPHFHPLNLRAPRPYLLPWVRLVLQEFQMLPETCQLITEYCSSRWDLMARVGDFLYVRRATEVGGNRGTRDFSSWQLLQRIPRNPVGNLKTVQDGSFLYNFCSSPIWGDFVLHTLDTGVFPWSLKRSRATRLGPTKELGFISATAFEGCLYIVSSPELLSSGKTKHLFVEIYNVGKDEWQLHAMETTEVDYWTATTRTSSGVSSVVFKDRLLMFGRVERNTESSAVLPQTVCCQWDLKTWKLVHAQSSSSICFNDWLFVPFPVVCRNRLYVLGNSGVPFNGAGFVLYRWTGLHWSKCTPSSASPITGRAIQGVRCCDYHICIYSRSVGEEDIEEARLFVAANGVSFWEALLFLFPPISPNIKNSDIFWLGNVGDGDPFET